MQCREVEMIGKIKNYLYIGSIILLLIVILITSISLYISNKKIENLKGVNDNLVRELSIIKEQVCEMKLRIDTFKVSEKVTQDYVEKKDKIEDNMNVIKDEVYDAIINDPETCDWWNTSVPDTISSILNGSSIMCRDKICN